MCKPITSTSRITGALRINDSILYEWRESEENRTSDVNLHQCKTWTVQKECIILTYYYSAIFIKLVMAQM